MVPETQKSTDEEKKLPSLDQIHKYVEKAKAEKIPDEEIYDFLKSKGVFNVYNNVAGAAGVSEGDQKKFIGQQLGIDPRKQPNPTQRALEVMVGVLPWVGEKLEIKELEETKGLPGALYAGAISAPRTLIDLPTALTQASIQHHFPGTEQPPSPIQTKFGEFRPELGYTPPEVTEEGQISPYAGVPEQGDIGPLIRAILPNAQETTEALVAESAMPETPLGEAAFRAAQFAGGGLVGGGQAALIGGGLGALDTFLEKQGYSPEGRAAIELLIGKVPEGTPGPVRPLPFGKIGERPGAPPPDTFFKQWKKSFAQKSRKPVIESVADLAAKVFLRDSENINFQTIADLKELGFDLSDVPIQTYTKGGLPNWLEGAQEQSLWSGKSYKKLMGQFSDDMVKRADAVLDSIPLQEINDEVTHQSLGEPVFQNYVFNTLNEIAPNLNIDRKTIGRLGTETIERMDTTLKQKADSLYDEVNFTDNDFIEPNSEAYKSLERVVNRTKEEIKGAGYIGAEREEALRVIGAFQQLFKKKQIGGTKEILGPSGEPFAGQAKPNILYSDLQKNLQAGNKKVNYEKPGAINLIKPIFDEIRRIFNVEAINNPKLVPFLQAQEVFGQRANLLKDSKIRKFYNMDDEQFYNAMKKPSNLEAFKKFAEETDNIDAYDQLRGGLLAKELGPAFEAKTPGEMASKLSDNLIERIRDIQQFYPEYPDFANGLKTAREGAKNFTSKDALKRSQIREEAIDFQMSGETPTKILSTMDTPKGINFVKDTLSQTDQGKALYNTMARKKLEQTMYGKIGKNEITGIDLAKIFKDPKADAIIKTLISDENYKQLKTLSRIAESLEEGKGVSPKTKREYDKMVLSTMGISGTLSAATLGLFSGFLFGAAPVAIPFLAKGALSKNFRKSLISQTQNLNPNSSSRAPSPRVP